jgi:glycosyltransferase involved in cell wall biosynthesis
VVVIDDDRRFVGALRRRLATVPHLEVVGDAGVHYRGGGGADALREVLRELLADPDGMAALQAAAAARARALFSWEAVTDAYEGLARRASRPR